MNVTGIISGTPYLTIPTAATSLTPRRLATVTAQFSNPLDAIINFVGDLLREPGTNDQQPLSFSSAVVGASARTLTVNGANFVSNSTVTYSAVAHASTFVSAS